MAALPASGAARSDAHAGARCPYIGPMPLGEADPIFGRDAEIDELRDRLVADRIVLLYSPSGAGKSSLIEAGLRPRLADRFDVLPSARVSVPYDGGNRYVTSVLHCWAARAGLAPRPDDTLLSCLARLEDHGAGGRARRLLIVLDQFEEIFTLDSTDLAAKRAFFAQLGELLGRGGSPVWALVAMREEYFSWLDAYRELVPTRLVNTMRIDLLSREQALQALRGPALAAGVDFREDAARQLVTDLAQVRTRDAAGQVSLREGRYVEPVQLQVVGLSLWQSCFGPAGPPARGGVITLEQVRHLDTGAALASYCNLALDAATATRIRQRVVRDWIENSLITATNMRAQATLDAGSRNAPTAAELDVLQQYHLVRAQSRQDAQWLELAHDRLIEPVRASNAQWRTRYLPHWKQLARAWALSGENPGVFGKLTSTEELDDTLLEAEDRHSEAENRFLAAYQRHRAERERARRWHIFGYSLAGATLLFLIVVVVLAWQLRATKQDLAMQNALFSLLGSRPTPDAALLAAVEGTRGQPGHARPEGFDFRRSLVGAMNRARHIEAYLARADQQMLEVQADAGYRATARLGGSRQTVDITALEPGGRTVRLDETALRNQHPAGVRVFALTGAGTLATGGQDGSVAVWNAARPARATVLLPPPDAGRDGGWGAVSALSSDGRRLVAGYDRGGVAVWDLARAGDSWRRPIAGGRAHALRVAAAVLFDQGRQLATAGRDGKARLWRLPEDPQADPALLTAPEHDLPAPAGEADWYAGYHSIAVSPDGRLAVAGTRGGRISVWRTADGELWPRPLQGHDDAVARLVFTDDRQLLSGGWDGRVIRWQLDPERMQSARNELLDLPSQITGLALAGKDQRLFASTEQGELLQMRFDAPRHPMASVVSRGRDETPLLLALAGVAPPLAAAAENGKLVLLQAEAGKPASRRPVALPAAPVRALDWARRARRLAVADDNGQIWLLDADGNGRPILPGVMAGAGTRLTLSDDARLLAVRSGDPAGERRLELWRLAPDAGAAAATASMAPAASADEAMTCRIALPEPLAHAAYAAFRPGTAELAVAEDDKISLWRIALPGAGCGDATAAVALRFEALPRGQVTSLAFDARGTALVAGNYLGKVYRLALPAASGAAGAAQAAPAILKQDAAGVITALAAPEAPFVVAGDDHGNLFLLDRETERPLPVPQTLYRDPRQPIAALSVSDDGRWLYAAGTSLSAIWDLDMAHWRQQACAIVGGGFTAAQKAEFFKGDTPRPTACEPH
ncbi:NACHT and WD repeat domain-containing protein [Cupriavidus sp. 30B13]|uniref:NACHT and WD repeat domain-containing protein n=1 Tax=Cupriavidus sp. 30B13 TaxID=3384241 RepID=UPI003B903729